MTLEDDELENAFVRQPDDYFQAVYDRYSNSLFRFLYRFTANKESAEGLLQDIFLELLKGRFKSFEKGTLKSWLFTLARNRGLNHLKKNRHEINQDLSSLSTNRSLEDDTIQLNLLSHLAHFETKLPRDLQETWGLRKSGYDYEGIAKALTIPVGTVKSRFSRLVEILRKEFES